MDATTAAYWRALVPSLHCEDDPPTPAPRDPNAPARHQHQQLLRHLQRDAFVRIPCRQAGTAELAGVLLPAIERLAAAGWPALFILVYDEAWQLADLCGDTLRLITDSAAWRLNYDCYAWRVRPGSGGWPPHRDRPHAPEGPGGVSSYLTAWVALSSAQPGERTPALKRKRGRRRSRWGLRAMHSGRPRSGAPACSCTATGRPARVQAS